MSRRLIPVPALCLLLLAAAGLPLRAEVPVVATAAAPAAAEHAQHDLDWHDAARQRAVPVRLYWPAQAEAGGGAAVPLIMFSHGIGGSRRGYRYLGQYWASQGYASLHVQHVGSDRSLWSGNPLGLVGRLQDAAQEGEAIHRARDVSFALDRLLQGEWGARIDANRIVAAGHSYGANTSLLLAGARVQRPGAVLDLRDARFKAALIISAPPFYGESDPASILAPVSIPTLHITATEDVIRIPGYYSDARDRLRVFDATGSATKSLVVFEGGSHSIFTDRDGTGGMALNPKVKAATRELTLAFLSQVFEGRAEGMSRWNERWGGLLASISNTSVSR
jgi:predicted dienelactone hydrolase